MQAHPEIEETMDIKVRREPRVPKDPPAQREIRDGVDTKDREESQELVAWLAITVMMDQ